VHGAALLVNPTDSGVMRACHLNDLLTSDLPAGGGFGAAAFGGNMRAARGISAAPIVGRSAKL
jgi:hypothetical protein